MWRSGNQRFIHGLFFSASAELLALASSSVLTLASALADARASGAIASNKPSEQAGSIAGISPRIASSWQDHVHAAIVVCLADRPARLRRRRW
jgi:hypothetical protein